MISVIVPLYNEQDYIENCLNSIITQTYKDIEVINIPPNTWIDINAYICIDDVKKLHKTKTYFVYKNHKSNKKKVFMEKCIYSDLILSIIDSNKENQDGQAENDDK